MTLIETIFERRMQKVDQKLIGFETRYNGKVIKGEKGEKEAKSCP